MKVDRLIRLIETLAIVGLLTTAAPPSVAQKAPSPLVAANEVLEYWTARKDVSSNLFANESDRWAIRTTAARLYPALVLTAWFTNQHLYNGLLLETLHDERRLTPRLSVFPDDYDLDSRRFVRSSRDTDEILINAAAYAGGLFRIASVVGASPWTERLRGIVDALFLRADVETDYTEGPLPSADIRVNGHILKTLPLLAQQFDDNGYLYYARRIGDAYCVGILPENGGIPARRWDFGSDRARDAALTLDDHGVSLIEGLVALYTREVAEETARAEIYRPTLSAMFDVIFAQGYRPDGGFHGRIEPDGRGAYAVDRRRSPHTVRLLNAAHHYGIASGNAAYSDRAVAELARYRLTPESPLSAVSALLGTVSWSNRARELAPLIRERLSAAGERISLLDEEAAAGYVDALLALAWETTAGTRARPWRGDLEIRADAVPDTLHIAFRAESRWSGTLLPSYDRVDLPVLAGGFPNRFTIRPDSDYEIRHNRARSIWEGALLSDGLRAAFDGPAEVTIIETVSPTPASGAPAP